MKMKCFPMFIIFCMLVNNGYSQKKREECDLNKGPVWEYCMVYPRPITGVCSEQVSVEESLTFLTYYVNGEYEKNGNWYKRLFVIQSTDDVLYEPTEVCGIREEKGMLILDRETIDMSSETSLLGIADKYPPLNSDELILMDFSLALGDTLFGRVYASKKDSVFITIDKVEPIMLCDGSSTTLEDLTYHYYNKRQNGMCSVIDRTGRFQAIKGIGYVTTFFAPFFNDLTMECYPFLNRFWEDGVLIYQASTDVGDPSHANANYYTFRENPKLKEMMSVADVSSPVVRLKKNSTLFDLQGRRLRSKPEKGLYIQDGKVRMAR